MRMKIISLLIAVSCLFSGQLCFAKDKTVAADKLTRGDVKKALLAGEITSNCSMGDFTDADATLLNPGSIIIKGIHQDDYEATIHFMGKLKKNVRSDERAVVCEANLVRLDSGEWQDPETGNLLEK